MQKYIGSFFNFKNRSPKILAVLLVGRFLLSWVVAKFILPAQVLFFYLKFGKHHNQYIANNGVFDKGLEVTLHFFKHKVDLLTTLDSVEIIAGTQKQPGHSYIIKFLGNSMDCMDEYLLQELKHMASHIGNTTITSFNYPNVAKSIGIVYSQKQLVHAGIAQVQRLLSKGVKPEQITLHGLSLGGAIATLVAAHFHTQKTPQKVYLINDRSFSSITDVILPPNRKSHWLLRTLKMSMNAIVKLFLSALNLNLNVIQAYQSIPKAYKMLIVSKHDTVIAYDASLYRAIKTRVGSSYSDNYIKISKNRFTNRMNELHCASIFSLRARCQYKENFHAHRISTYIKEFIKKPSVQLP